VPGVESKVTGVISWAVAGGLAAWAAARVTGADRGRRSWAPVTPLLSLTPLAAAAAPGAALGLALARRKGPAVTAALAAAALGAVTLPRAARRPQPTVGGPVLRVLTMNVLCGRADPEVVVALVRRTGADVLFLQELTGDAAARLSQAGLDELMPQKITELRGSSLGSGIYARFPLSEGQALAPTYAAQPTAVLKLPGGQAVELGCAHPRAPLPPTPQAVGRWRRELAVLPAPGEIPRVLAGDFNATLDHARFRQLLRLGYADAAAQAGNALVPTWGPLGRPAVITIDHVLVDRRCAVLASSVHAVPGTDHRAVYAEVRLPGSVASLLARQAASHGGKDPLDHGREPVLVVFEPVVAHREGIESRELLQVGGQLPLARHKHPVDEHRDDAHAALECGSDFEPYVIIRIVEPTAVLLIRDRQPLGADQGDQDHTRVQGGFDGFREINARLDGVQVHEDQHTGEAVAQVLLQEARVGASVLAPVADKDSMRRRER
jgi:endonuclease/exonuclease/phosphatase (EEP) superfamily protein YafD